MGINIPQLDANLHMKYLPSLQIYNPTNNLCLDDGGKEVLGTSSLSAVVAFKPCDSSSINQQFIFTTGNQILNPNWPNNQVCLDGNGNTYQGYRELILWGCKPSDANQLFSIVLICPTGAFVWVAR